MAIDPLLQVSYSVNTPPLVAPRTQGQIISLMNINQMRHMAFEPFSNALLPCGVFVTATTDGMGKTIVTQPTAPGTNIVGATVWNQQRKLVWNATLGFYQYDIDEQVTLAEEADIVFYSETATEVGQPVYNRLTVSGALNRIGAISNVAGAGLELVPRARFLEKSAPGLVRIHVDF